jgi:hypothetical protein
VLNKIVHMGQNASTVQLKNSRPVQSNVPSSPSVPIRAYTNQMRQNEMERLSMTEEPQDTSMEQNESTIRLKNNRPVQSNAASISKRVYTNQMRQNELKRTLDVEVPVFLPKQPSDMTPIQIAEQLERDLQQLEGPVYASVLAPTQKLEDILGRKPPVFLLLGDFHGGTQKCDSCEKPGCYSLYKGKGNNRSTFLDYLNTQTKKNWIIDVFFEKWVGKKVRESGKQGHQRNQWNYNPNERELRKERGEQTSPLHDWIFMFKPCLGYIQNPYAYNNSNRSRCDYTHFRIHEAEMRHTTDQLFNGIMKEWCFNLLNYWSKKDAGYILYLLDITIKKYIKKMNISEFVDLLIFICKEGTTIKSVLQHPYFKYSRTVHELEQLPPELYIGIINNPALGLVFSLNDNPLLIELRPIVLHLCEIIKGLQIDDTILGASIPIEHFVKCIRITDKFIDNSNTLNLYTSLVDLYTIARALKPFKQGYETSLYSQLAVSYFGGAHIHRIELLLKQWYTPSVKWGTDNLKLLINSLQPDMKIVKCITQIKKVPPMIPPPPPPPPSMIQSRNSTNGGRRTRNNRSRRSRRSRRTRKR